MSNFESREGRRHFPVKAGLVLGKFVKRLDLDVAVEVLKAWPEAAGEFVARHLVALRFENGTLWVRSEDSVWSQQLTFLKPKLLEHLTAALKRTLVRDIRLSTMSPLADSHAGLDRELQESRRPLPKVQLPRDEIAAIEAKALEVIRDPNLAHRWANVEARVRSVHLARKNVGGRPCRRCGVICAQAGSLCPVCHWAD